MTKETDIKRLYTHGWDEPPEWAKKLRWKHPLWAYSEQPATATGLLSYCRSMQKWVVPDKRIAGPDGSPYLDRYCIAAPPDADGDDLSGKIYLNHFLRSDEDPELHSHPWDRSLSLILVNGYEEERRIGDQVMSVSRAPGDLVLIEEDTFHRVDLVHEDAWTLFFTGRFVNTWYFWNRTTGKKEQWENFLRARGRRA